MSPKKKIIVFTTSYLPFIGGAEIAIQEVSKRLCDTFDFIIITARQKRNLPKREMFPEGVVIRLGFGSSLDKWFLPLVSFFAVIMLAVRDEIPKPWRRASRGNLLLWGMDISQGSLSGYFIKRMFPRIPFVCTVQYGYGDARLAHARGGAIGFAFRRILRVVDGVTVISSYLMDIVHTYGFVGVETIIPNGVDMSLFAFQQRVDTEKNKSSQRVIITTSRLVEKNGVDVLIRAVAEAKKIVPAIKCYIIGDGPERSALEKLTHELGLSRDIIFLGSIPYEEIPFYLRKADVFVRPSRSEGMGNSFVEALSVGIPIIGTPMGGIPDIIKEGITGIFCRVDDYVDVAQKILMILNDASLVARMRENGRRLVEEKFLWDTIARSYGDFFEKLLNVRLRTLVATPLYPPEIGGPATYSKILVDGMLDMGVLIRVTRFSGVRQLPKILRHWTYAMHLLRQSRYVDILYAQDPVSVGFPAAIIAIITRKKFAVKIVGDYAWEQGVQRFEVRDLLDEFLQRLYSRPVELLRTIERFTARRATKIIVPSEYLKTVVVRWGIAEDKITVIGNSFEMPRHIISRSRAKVMLGLTGHVLISAGRLVPWKGFGTVISAVSALIKKNIPLSLIIIGSGPLEKELRDAIIALDAGAYIRCIGRVEHDEMLGFLAAADAFVLNTGYEGFSHALLEAMAMGAMVITTSVGGNVELIANGENGFLVEYDNQDQLTDAIQSVFDMPTREQERIILNAQKTAEQFSTARMLNETAQFLMLL